MDVDVDVGPRRLNVDYTIDLQGTTASRLVCPPEAPPFLEPEIGNRQFLVLFAQRRASFQEKVHWIFQRLCARFEILDLCLLTLASRAGKCGQCSFTICESTAAASKFRGFCLSYASGPSTAFIRLP